MSPGIDAVDSLMPTVAANVPSNCRWSVMIPTFNCAQYLRRTLASVLAQDPGPAHMQIEVVDDCSTADRPDEVVHEMARGRVAFFRQPANAGIVANFNTCVARSRGELVHILHGDDTVEPGFYARIGELASDRPDAAWYACRAFFIDEFDHISTVSKRLPLLESGTRDASAFYYDTPVPTPGVVVRRDFYLKHEGFRPGFPHLADREMWCRTIHLGGGVMLPDVRARYRVHGKNDTSTRLRTGANLAELRRFAEVQAIQYPDFDLTEARHRIALEALKQTDQLAARGDSEGAKACFEIWRELTPRSVRRRMKLRNILARVFGLEQNTPS